MFTLNDIVQGNDGMLHFHNGITPDSDLVFPSAHHDSRQIERGGSRGGAVHDTFR